MIGHAKCLQSIGKRYSTSKIHGGVYIMNTWPLAIQIYVNMANRGKEKLHAELSSV